MTVRKVLTNAVQRDAKGVRTHHHGSPHVSEGHYRHVWLRVSRGRVGKQESDYGGAVVIGIEAFHVYVVLEHERNAVVKNITLGTSPILLCVKRPRRAWRQRSVTGVQAALRQVCLWRSIG
jgi:hypothetical protein